MNRRWLTARRGAVAVAGIFVAGVVVVGTAHFAGLYVNNTVSLPRGIYRAVNAPIQPGAYVAFCPPQEPVIAEAKKRGYLAGGFCPGGYLTMMKQVLAAKGDRVVVAADGVRINGRLVPLTAQMPADGGGRPMPHYVMDRTLGEELLVMGQDSAISFDSRYFGPVARSQVRSVIQPVLTW